MGLPDHSQCARRWTLSLLATFCGSSPFVHADTSATQLNAFIVQHCTSCHSGDESEADLNLASLADQQLTPANRKTWIRILEVLHRRQMPPNGESQPSEQQIQTTTKTLHYRLLLLDGLKGPNPGHVTLRRLNRTEYQNLITDLFHINIDVTKDFPADDTGYGFDTIGDVLSISPLLFEKYLATAEKITDVIFSNQEISPEGTEKFRGDIPSDDDDWKSYARHILAPVARGAFRRPVRDDELDKLLEFVDQAKENDKSFEHGIRLALHAILISPDFLFHVIRTQSSKEEEAETVVSLSEFEFASRLSFFLWSRGPDEELFALAEQNRLRDDTILTQQVRRMLAHERAGALADNFASQWLQLSRLTSVAPDPDLFPDFDDDLRLASREETTRFFASILREDQSILTLLDANYSFLNERLARHYNIPEVNGPEFRRVSLPTRRRGGLLGQSSILTLTSNSTRTSPVKRGKWILEEILGAPPPPPPPNVEDLSETKEAAISASLRDRLEEHLSNESCASCHRVMDPLGFALENYNAIGAWRERDGKFPINASGTLPDGTFLDGPRGIKSALLARKHDFVRCLTEKMFVYAMGRGIEYYDLAAIETIVTAVENDNYRMSRLVLEVIRSVPFQMKRQQRRSS
ncbi:MAG: DUF1592 domain-containing protein [Pirellulaceae bacterium]|nr:DUF1592 domain-containing protein [Pirellulaceae bacterium]